MRAAIPLLLCCSVLLALLLSGAAAVWADEFTFDLEEFEKKSLEWGGYLQGRWEHSEINGDGALAYLTYDGDSPSTLDGFGTLVQLDGSYAKGLLTLNWVAQAEAVQDERQWADRAEIFEAYLSMKLDPSLTLDVGKKVMKWGKGYAWNPVGFVDRPKDPNNPEEAMEGFAAAGIDMVGSYGGALRTMALTTVVVPVWQGVNEDFGVRGNVNLAMKLYLLYLDTDIDLLCFTGNSRSSRFGIDFSRNLAANFEIHAELAHVPAQRVARLTENGIERVRQDDTSYLLGLRYLSEDDITTIVEYYHNDDGYSEKENERFFRSVDEAGRIFELSGDDSSLKRAAAIGAAGFLRPQGGRDYLYLRSSWKEPFDLLYFTPALTAIVNCDDGSASLSPELLYSGFTNWELRLRATMLAGASMSEYGEKSNRNKLELRLRYFF